MRDRGPQYSPRTLPMPACRPGMANGGHSRAYSGSARGGERRPSPGSPATFTRRKRGQARAYSTVNTPRLGSRSPVVSMRMQACMQACEQASPPPPPSTLPMRILIREYNKRACVYGIGKNPEWIKSHQHHNNNYNSNNNYKSIW